MAVGVLEHRCGVPRGIEPGIVRVGCDLFIGQPRQRILGRRAVLARAAVSNGRSAGIAGAARAYYEKRTIAQPDPLVAGRYAWGHMLVASALCRAGCSRPGRRPRTYWGTVKYIWRDRVMT